MNTCLLKLMIALACLAAVRAHAGNTVTVNPDQTISINGTPFFPISVYLQSHWAGAKELGANVASRPFCVNTDAIRKAERKRLYLHYTAGPGCDEENAEAIRRRQSRAFTASIEDARDSDFILGYGLPDEPVSANDLTTSDTEWAYGIFKSADPAHPVFLTEYASDISAYRDSADIFLNDEYPFNNDPDPLYDVKSKLLRMKAQVSPKPVWLIIQTGSQFGMPTNRQIRAETYLSIALGSTGLIFYSYDVEDAGGVHNIMKDGDRRFMTDLVSELKDFSPVFLGRRNPGLVYQSAHIDAILRDHDPSTYLIAVNKSAKPQRISFSLPGFGHALATIVGNPDAGSSRAGQQLSLDSAGNLLDTLQGLEAVVYEIDRTHSFGGSALQAPLAH
ncbi:hypothetical protein AACH06_19095 [Ideonella sp. DXS29W]|uniref:Glycoside hydrolase family 42 N-terminal domain-containing protein n=1 Tax=Ideonella lacteola TaxID=2984193 RepID=A0ABU9BSI7_9BURK